MPLTYSLADVALKAAIARMDEMGVGLSIAVIDHLGQPVAAGRMSTARRGTTSWSAERKALRSLIGEPEFEIADREAILEKARKDGRFNEEVRDSGALPLEDHGEMVGVIAAGGGIGTAADREAAQAGEAAFRAALNGGTTAPMRPIGDLYGSHGGLSFELADQLLKAAMAKASEMDLRVSVAVSDEAGHPVAVGRMDGAPAGTTSWVAQGKALVAAIWSDPSRSTMERLGRPGSTIGSHAQELHGRRLVFEPGGFAFRDGVRVLGAIGVDGATDEQDEEVALAGIAALEESAAGMIASKAGR